MEREELIDKFLNGSLSDAELETFKAKWANDKAFVNEVRAYAELKIALQAGNNAIKNDKNIEKGITSTWNKRPFYYSLAASIALLLVAVPLFLVLKSPTSKDLARGNLINYRLQGVRTANAPDNPMDQALRANANGQSSKAITILKKELKDNETSAQYLFTLADLYLVNNQPDSAIYYYTQGSLSDQQDPYTRWNLIMAELQKGKVDTAKTMLKKMAASETPPYDQKAKGMLEKINAPGFKIRRWLNW